MKKKLPETIKQKFTKIVNYMIKESYQIDPCLLGSSIVIHVSLKRLDNLSLKWVDVT